MLQNEGMHEHGSQYLSDHFLNQVRYWGIRPSFGLLSPHRGRQGEPKPHDGAAWRSSYRGWSEL